MNFADQFTANVNKDNPEKINEDGVKSEDSTLSGDSVNANEKVDTGPLNQAPQVDKREEDLDYAGPPKVVDQDFTYVSHTDPERAKDPNGIYLDDVQRRDAEIQRAKIEGREPDLVDPPAICGTPLIPIHVAAAQAVPGANVEPSKSLPVTVGVADDKVQSNQAAQDYRDRMDLEGTAEYENHHKNDSKDNE